MIDAFRWIALIAAIVCVVAFSGAIVLSSSQQAAVPTQQHNAAENEREQQNQKQYKTLWDTWFPEPISLYTLLLTVFTAVMAGGIFVQLNLLGRAERIAAETAQAAKDSADATNKAVALSAKIAERQLRAYVYLEVSGRPYPPPPKEPNRWAVSLNIKNGGSTWARNVRIKHAMVADPKTADPFDGVDWNKIKPNPLVLGPNQETAMQFGDLNGPELLDIIKNSRKIYYVAWITYEDVLSEPPITRQTQLSRRLNADTEGGVSFSWLETHNCADDDCPK